MERSNKISFMTSVTTNSSIDYFAFYNRLSTVANSFLLASQLEATYGIVAKSAPVKVATYFLLFKFQSNSNGEIHVNKTMSYDFC